MTGDDGLQRPSRPWVHEIAALRREIAELRAQRVTFIQGDVTDTDVGSNTFSALVDGLVDGDTTALSGIRAPSSFLPTVGDTVLIALSGAQPIYQPGGLATGSVGSAQIANGAVGTDKIADGTISQAKLTFDPADYSGSTIYYSPTSPTPPAEGFRIGDLWLQDTGNTGSGGEPNYLVYRWTSGGSWVLLQDQGVADALADALAAQTAATDALANAATAQSTADGKITAFYSSSAPASGMQDGDLWVDTDDNSLHRYNGSAWVSIQDAAISQALSDAATAQATADGKVKIFAQASPPTADGVGDLWIETDNGNKLYTWDGTIWQARQLGNSSIQPASLVASDVVATGTVTAALLEAELVLGSTIVAGDVNAEHAQLDSSGLYFVMPDPVDGTPTEVARFGRNSGGSNDSGVQTWGIDTDGVASFSALSLDSFPVVNGTTLDNHLADSSSQGTMVWFGEGANQSNIALEYGLAEVFFQAVPDRNYKVVFGGGFSSTNNNGEYAVRVRWTTDGTRPSTSSPILAERFQTHTVGGRFQDWEFSQFFQRDSNDPLSVHLLLTIARGTGQTTGTVSSPGTPPFIRVEDTGPYRVASGTNANDGSGGSPPVPQQLYTLTQAASWSKTFNGSGAARNDTTDCVQGWDPSGFNGDGRAMIGFPDLTGTLSGATIRALRVYLYANHWYYQSGGTAIIGTHAQSSAPALFSGTTNRLQSDSWARTAGRWVDLTAYATEFQAGTSRGITLGPSGGSNELYYGRFGGASDASHPPLIYVEYYK